MLQEDFERLHKFLLEMEDRTAPIIVPQTKFFIKKNFFEFDLIK